MKKLLAIIGYLIFSAIVITPFYTGLSLLKVLPSFMISTFWFLMVLMAGINDRLSWALILLYFIPLAILFSYGYIGPQTLGSMILGIIWAILIYFSNEMHLDEY